MSLHEPTAMSVDTAIRRRRSVRGFLPDELPEPLLREIFELAQRAPSNCNVQPWIPHVVSGATLRAISCGMPSGTVVQPAKTALAMMIAPNKSCVFNDGS